MNDDDLMTAVRDRFAAIRMDTPAEKIMARGSSLRRRGGRLAAGAARALAVSLGAGLSVPALTAGTAAPARHATLAAWTVREHHDGSIGVTVRRPQNLPALQLRLAKLGAPVIIVAGQARPGRGCAVEWIPAAFQIRFAPIKHAVAFELKPGKIPPHALLWIALPPGGAKLHATPVRVKLWFPRALLCKPLTALTPAH